MVCCWTHARDSENTEYLSSWTGQGTCIRLRLIPTPTLCLYACGVFICVTYDELCWLARFCSIIIYYYYSQFGFAVTVIRGCDGGRESWYQRQAVIEARGWRSERRRTAIFRIGLVARYPSFPTFFTFRLCSLYLETCNKCHV